MVSGYDGELPVVQHWNLNKVFSSPISDRGKHKKDNIFEIHIQAFDKNGQTLKKEVQKGWYSEKYGIKEDFNQLIFKTNKRFIETNIEIN